MRIVFSLLLGCVFSFAVVVGGSGELATRAQQPPYSIDSLRQSIVDFALIDSGHAWATDRHSLYHTNDGTRLRKQRMNFKGKTLLSFVDRNTGFAFCHAGLDGQVWRTTNAGETWQRLPDFNQDRPSSRLTVPIQLHFVDRKHGWLVDVFGVWRTKDGGLRWQEVFKTKYLEEVRQGSFNGIERATVITTHGIYVTTDAGKSWKLTNSKPNASVISFIDDNIGWVWSDSVMSTGDGGNTWHELYKWKSEGEIFSLHFINKNEGWAAGIKLLVSFVSGIRNPDRPALQGTLLHTVDGGNHWTELATPTDITFYRVVFSDSNHGWLVGPKRVYRTTDGGVTWSTALQAQKT